MLETMTQQQVADELGKTREFVKNYSALKNICKGAWDIIGTVFKKTVPIEINNIVPQIGTTVTFTENLLRCITSLTPDQQLSLVQDLASIKQKREG